MTQDIAAAIDFAKRSQLQISVRSSGHSAAGIYRKETYRRLAEIKRTYDPENIFNHNFNIKPAEG
jgi:FAD/FMN-containing dehydrogenase